MSSLNNTPWKYEAHADGTCDIYATDKRRETGLRWIGAAIDEPTALAIAALPDTLAELERVKEERNELKDFVQEFYNLKNPSNKQWLEITEKAKQLLTSKE